MVHTLPPWTSKWKMATVFGRMDHAELAARLGGLSKFDRRGQVIWQDDFEAAVLRWLTAAGESGTTAVLSNVRTMSKEQACRIDTGDAANNYIRCTRYLNYPVLSKIGFEISNTYHAYVKKLYWGFWLWTGTTVIKAGVQWTNSTNMLSYISLDNNGNQFPAGTTTDFQDGVDFNLGIYGFNTVKLVVDFTTGKYVRFIHNNVTYDMSGYSYFEESETSTPPQMHVQFGVEGADDSGYRDAEVYFDNAIVTQNEDV